MATANSLPTARVPSGSPPKWWLLHHRLYGQDVPIGSKSQAIVDPYLGCAKAQSFQRQLTNRQMTAIKSKLHENEQISEIVTGEKLPRIERLSPLTIPPIRVTTGDGTEGRFLRYGPHEYMKLRDFQQKFEDPYERHLQNLVIDRSQQTQEHVQKHILIMEEKLNSARAQQDAQTKKLLSLKEKITRSDESLREEMGTEQEELEGMINDLRDKLAKEICANHVAYLEYVRYYTTNPALDPRFNGTCEPVADCIEVP